MLRARAILGIVTFAALSWACAPAATEANKATVRQMIEAMNARDFDALDGLVAGNIQRHSAATPGVVVENLGQFKDFLRQDLAAIPDASQEVRLMVAEGDLVALFGTYRGTQRGQMGPFPPSDRVMEIPFVAFLRLADGKIAEMWVEWDNVNALVQLGHFPPPPAPEG